MEEGYGNQEIIVVDCCTDGIEGALGRWRNIVKLVRLPSDVGASEEHNAGFRNADKAGKYILFLDNDTEVSPGCLDRLVERAEASGAAIVQPSIFSLSDRERLLENGLRAGIFGVPKPNRGNEVPFFTSGCGYLVRSDAFRGAGGYDSKFYLGVDDLDLSWRVRLLGHTMALEPSAKVYHGVGSQSSRLKPMRFYNILKNTVRMILKNYSSPRNLMVASAFLVRIPLEGALLWAIGAASPTYKKNVLAKVKTGSRSELGALYLRAMLWNAKNLRDTIALRQGIQRNRKISDAQIMGQMKDRGLIFMSESYDDLV